MVAGSRLVFSAENKVIHSNRTQNDYFQLQIDKFDWLSKVDNDARITVEV